VNIVNRAEKKGLSYEIDSNFNFILGLKIGSVFIRSGTLRRILRRIKTNLESGGTEFVITEDRNLLARLKSGLFVTPNVASGALEPNNNDVEKILEKSLKKGSLKRTLIFLTAIILAVFALLYYEHELNL
jgi:hypothetical protein